MIEWTGPPEAEEGPASAIEVVPNITQPGEKGAENQDGEQQGSGFLPIVAYGGLSLGALALVVALLALHGASRKG